ncbi:MAG: response regulator [Treponema sp.]|jgi:CheY-like chemotaxis protein/HPt (histidine-containing phosphotransfer) domain-containing protein|nr:response regulator [Treponema sp.]
MEKSKKNSVLIVDDEDIDLRILSSILSPEYTVYVTKNGNSTIEMVNKYMPDIILLDIIMPDKSGYEVLADLKKNPETQSIPIIFISGLDSNEDEEKGLALGAVDFIHKPFSPVIAKLRVRYQIQTINQFRFIEQFAHEVAATEERSKFFAKMSHEMRTPLNAVIGLSEIILEEGGLSEETQINIEKISNSGSLLLSLVNDILDISKIETGMFELMSAEYGTASMINDTVTQSIIHKGEKPIEFVMDIDENIPARLFGDELRVKQILNNLLSNAFKYTKEGTVELTVKSEMGENETVFLIASVRDTGVGIKNKDLERLFSDYTRIVEEDSYTEGTGLGLSVSKMLTDMMNGEISVISEYGKGSVFTVRLQQKLINGDTIGMDIAASLKNLNYHVSRRDRKSLLPHIILPYAHVLVVDDVITNIDVAKGMMKPYKIQVDCVTSGKAAIDAMREEKIKYNAIFMDHMMPEMDGIEAVRIIREEIGTEYAKTIPIIACTANALAGNDEMFLRCGFQDYLYKPIEIPRLDAIIRQWLRNEEQEKLYEAQEITEKGTSSFDPLTGRDRRSGKDRRKTSHPLFESKIEGMDIQKGLERFGGDRETFLQIVQSFAKNTRSLLETLKEVNKSNLADYAINVHGAKSSCRGICAAALGNRAEALEKAAKSGDLDFVIANNAAFIEDVLKLIANIEAVLAAGTVKKEKIKKDKPYMEVLLKLQTACDNYQIEEIDASMNEIECFEYTNDDGLALWLRENVDQMNYMDIVEKLRT